MIKEKKHDDIVRDMFNMILMKGDVLLLDKVDVFISSGDINNLMAEITNCRKCWNEIYLSGYSPLMNRAFIDTDKNTFATFYDPNYCFVIDNGSDLILKHITEEEANEYFDSI